MNLTAAKSQKAETCPISFILDDQSGGGIDPIEEKMFIRPEDMTRTYPSRASVNQTLGGAWVDSFGAGLEATTISGTLGWRTGPSGRDGLDRLIDMRKNVYDNWHALRDDALARGDDPTGVQLIFVDTLNGYIRTVVPQVFEIRRSKSRPLLASYRISFTAVSQSADPLSAFRSIAGLAGAVDPSGFGLGSLGASIDELIGYVVTAKNFVDSTILAPVVDFMHMSNRVLTNVRFAIQAGLSIATPLMNVAQALTWSGLNVFRTLAAVAGIPMQVRATLMQVAGAYSNIFCVLKNALKAPATYENYGGLYGASNCSSTSGGLPPSTYAGENPFFKVSPLATSQIGLSSDASRAISLITKKVTWSPTRCPSRRSDPRCRVSMLG